MSKAVMGFAANYAIARLNPQTSSTMRSSHSVCAKQTAPATFVTTTISLFSRNKATSTAQAAPQKNSTKAQDQLHALLPKSKKAGTTEFSNKMTAFTNELAKDTDINPTKKGFLLSVVGMFEKLNRQTGGAAIINEKAEKLSQLIVNGKNIDESTKMYINRIVDACAQRTKATEPGSTQTSTPGFAGQPIYA